MIDGVTIKPLKVIPDSRGRLMEIFRCDDPVFEKFGQVYITTTLPDIVKAWHYHKVQTDNFACVQGTIQVALFDARKDSPTFGEITELFMGVHKPQLISIPPGVFHGWKCVGLEEAIIVNVPSEPYNHERPDEYRLPWDEPSIPYDWTRRNG